jgi:hypothetical protein
MSDKRPQEEAGTWLDVLGFWAQMATAGELSKARVEYFGTRPDKDTKRTAKRSRKSISDHVFFDEVPLPI